MKDPLKRKVYDEEGTEGLKNYRNELFYDVFPMKLIKYMTIPR